MGKKREKREQSKGGEIFFSFDGSEQQRRPPSVEIRMTSSSSNKLTLPAAKRRLGAAPEGDLPLRVGEARGAAASRSAAGAAAEGPAPASAVVAIGSVAVAAAGGSPAAPSLMAAPRTREQRGQRKRARACACACACEREKRKKQTEKQEKCSFLFCFRWSDFFLFFLFDSSFFSFLFFSLQASHRHLHRHRRAATDFPTSKDPRDQSPIVLDALLGLLSRAPSLLSLAFGEKRQRASKRRRLGKAKGLTSSFPQPPSSPPRRQPLAGSKPVSVSKKDPTERARGTFESFSFLFSSSGGTR